MIYPKVNILILHWKGKELLEQCLESIFKIDYPNFIVTIIDNGSPDDSIDNTRKKYSDIRIIHLKNNMGFSKGYNLAFSKLKKNSDEYYFLLNNDTLINTDTISNLIYGTKIFGEKNIYGPKILNYKNDCIWYAGGKINKITKTASHNGLDQLEHIKEFKSSETDFVSGCALLIKKQLIDDLKGFDESFKFYYEDVDLCIRARKLNIKSIFINNSTVYHKISSSFGGRYNLQKVFYHLESKYKFIYIHNNFLFFSIYIFINILLLPFTVLVKFIKIVIK